MSTRNTSGGYGAPLAFQVPPDLIDAIARRAAELVTEQRPERSPYLDAEEAAAYLRCEKQRVYDLVSAGSLVCCRDGRRLLFSRDDLDSYLRGAS